MALKIIAPRNRRAALIATALTLPVIVVLAILFAPSSGSGSSTAAATATVTVSGASPSPDTVGPCAKVVSELPVQLDGNNPRATAPTPDTGAAAVSWGDPPIVFLCGVERPKALTEGSSAFIVAANGVNWLPVTSSNATVFTVIDRSVYIQVTVPKAYAQPPLATLSTAIATALPPVCGVASDGPAATATSSPSIPSGTAGPTAAALPLCTHRA